LEIAKSSQKKQTEELPVVIEPVRRADDTVSAKSNNLKYFKESFMRDQDMPERNIESAPKPIPKDPYQKCFPKVTSDFKDSFPVFADILSKYGGNSRPVQTAAAVR